VSVNDKDFETDLNKKH